MAKLILIFSLLSSCLLSLPQAQAQIAKGGNHTEGNTSAALHEAISQLSQVRKALKVSAVTSQTCETPTVEGCTFGGICSKFANKAQNFYLYQDEDGHQVPNFQMINYVQVAEACARKPFPQAAVNDPFAYPEQLVSVEKAGGLEQKKKNLEKYNKELNRVRGIFDDVQKRVVTVLESRRTASNSTEIDNMIQRIKTAKFAAPKLGDGIYTLSADGCESPNAFYEPSKHSVTVCPQFLNLPDATLFATLSHELGHSIDPCSMVYSYSQGKKGLELNYPPFLGGSGQKGPLQIRSIAINKNPMGTVISCLQSPSSIGVKVPSKEGLISAIDQEEEALRKEVAADSEGVPGGEENGIPKGELGDATLAGFEDQRKTVNDHYDTYKFCGDFTNSGHVQEAWSDWVASQTLATKVSEISDSKKAQQYAFASEAVFFSIGCENIGQAALGKVKAAAGGLCPHLDEVESLITEGNNSGGSNSHPQTEARVNRLMLAKPEIQKALGCKASSENNGSECK